MAGYAGLQDGFRTALQQLVAASHGRITLTSGYRTTQEQAALYRQKPNLAAPPGQSNHERGLAADLGGDLELAHKLAPQFGLFFPMLDPKGKKYEPWHIELAGTKAASPSAGYPSGSTTAPSLKDPSYLMAAFNAIIRNQVPQFKASHPGTNIGDKASTGRTSSGVAPTGTDIDRFLASVRTHESGGNYRVKGPSTRYGRATGAYQYLDTTWNGRGGYAHAADAPPEFQDAEARKDAQRLYDKYGDWKLVAIAWHGGPGAVKAAQRTGSAGTSDGLQTTDQYASDVLAGMR